jgi:lysophospholipase L1-like esterase
VTHGIQTVDDSARRSGIGRAVKLVALALLPTLLVLGIAEVTVRVLGLDQPRRESGPLYEEVSGMTRRDPDLFWSMLPNLQGIFQEKVLSTNSLGLRSPAVGAKIPGEVRVLCLGESTTFGFGVADDETYAFRAERSLNASGARPIRLINAGVTAYTIFQSLIYLKTRGLALEPDAVVLYHWANDFLPTTYRDSQHHEIGTSRSDRELYRFYKSLYIDKLVRYSALFRAGVNFAARRSIDEFRRRRDIDPSEAPEQLDWGSVFFPHQFPVRVKPQERREILAEFLQLSRTHGFELIVIHPVYRDVDSRDDILTEFCRENDVPLIDPLSAFQTAGLSKDELFLDSMHPTADGHALLATALATYLATVDWRDEL